MLPFKNIPGLKLTHLFQQSLCGDNSIPVIWKQTYITPIYKKGNRLDPKNYCPVSLASLVCKTMLEHIWPCVSWQIMRHLEWNNILTEVQHGFRSKHSCEAQLFLTINDLAKPGNWQEGSGWYDHFQKLLIKSCPYQTETQIGVLWNTRQSTWMAQVISWKSEKIAHSNSVVVALVVPILLSRNASVIKRK